MTTTDSRHMADARPHSHQRDARLDAAFDALASRRCRALLEHLTASDDGALVVDDLAARLAADDEDEDRIRSRLHHTHLPKLVDADLVAYDADRGLVRDATSCRFEAIRSAVAEFETGNYPVSLDALFELLADFRRRCAFVTLLGHGELSLPDLADEVAMAETGDPLPEVDPDDVLQVYLSLYHTHVPKLVDTDLVAYDQNRDLVALTDDGRALESPVRDLCAADG